MVQLSELTARSAEQLEQELERETKDGVVSYSDDDDDEYEDETLLERVLALGDMLPPRLLARTATAARSALRLAGTAAWLLSTTLFVFALPGSLELEREAMAVQQEMAMRQPPAAPQLDLQDVKEIKA